MEPKQSKPIFWEYIAKLVFMTVFLGGFALFIGYMLNSGAGWDALRLSLLDIVLLSLATLRLGRMFSYDRVMEPLRQFVAETRPDPTGAGDTVEPKGTGFQQSLGQLASCPICVGTWIAAVLVYALHIFPEPARVFVTIMAVVGAAEVLNALVEHFSWTGQYMRTMAGGQMLARRKNVIMRMETDCPDALLPPKVSKTGTKPTFTRRKE